MKIKTQRKTSERFSSNKHGEQRLVLQHEQSMAAPVTAAGMGQRHCQCRRGLAEATLPASDCAQFNLLHLQEGKQTQGSEEPEAGSPLKRLFLILSLV